MPTCLLALTYYVPTCLKSLRAYVPYMPTCLCALRPSMPLNVTCLRAYVLTYLQRLTKYTEAHFYTLYCCFSLDYLTFHSIQNPQTNSFFYNCIPQSYLVEYCYVGYCYLLVGIYDQIRRKLRISSHLLKKSLMENFIFCAVLHVRKQQFEDSLRSYLKQWTLFSILNA